MSKKKASEIEMRANTKQNAFLLSSVSTYRPLVSLKTLDLRIQFVSIAENKHKANDYFLTVSLTNLSK